jgi:hypothetical protein
MPTPARYWHETMMPFGFLEHVPEGGDPDELLLRWMERGYEEAKVELARRLEEGATEKELLSPRLGIYVSAIALLTYGRLDMVEAILTNNPGRPPLAPLVNSVAAIVPIPRNLSVYRDQAEIIDWIKAHQQ